MALIGDFNPSVLPTRRFPEALELAGAHHRVKVEGTWIHTSTIAAADRRLAGFDGIWCVPASPYANTSGALDAIRYAREQCRPFLGTCGGFQHALLEYARNVCGMKDAEHAETDPGAAVHLIAPLACSLVEQSGRDPAGGQRTVSRGIRVAPNHRGLPLQLRPQSGTRIAPVRRESSRHGLRSERRGPWSGTRRTSLLM